MTVVLCVGAAVCLLVAVFDEPNTFMNGSKAVVASAVVRSTALVVAGLLFALAGGFGS